MVEHAKPGFARHVLQERYDVGFFQEDPWHSYSAKRTASLIQSELARKDVSRLLNAGSGVYGIEPPQGIEVRLDLFHKPIQKCQGAVCANVEQLPFKSGVFDVVICVGEVLGYCDPASAIAEFARVTNQAGIVICDFESSLSARHWFKDHFRRAADLAVSVYNGTPERTWIYDPRYIEEILRRNRFLVRRKMGTHSWSPLTRRLGLRADFSLRIEHALRAVPLPATWAELTTFVAERM